MDKIFLIIKREFLSRVKKRSFLLATILIPLIFPSVIGGMIYLRIQSEENKEQEVCCCLFLLQRRNQSNKSLQPKNHVDQDDNNNGDGHARHSIPHPPHHF